MGTGKPVGQVGVLLGGVVVQDEVEQQACLCVGPGGPFNLSWTATGAETPIPCVEVEWVDPCRRARNRPLVGTVERLRTAVGLRVLDDRLADLLAHRHAFDEVTAEMDAGPQS